MTWHKLTNVGGVFHCDTSGHNCLTHVAPEEPAFLNAGIKKEMQDEVHDDVLDKLTNEMNEMLTEVAQKRKDKNLRILTTSRGLVLMWTSKGPAPSNAEQKELTDDEIVEIFGLTQY